MARQVNKKFVILLAGGLVLVAGAVGAYQLRRTLNVKDPQKLILEAVELEKKGDMDGAIRKRQEAFGAAAQQHKPDLDVMLIKLGDMYLDTSEKDPGRYANALDSWNQAEVYNPKNKEAAQRLLREHYALAQLANIQKEWEIVEQDATRLIGADPTNDDAYAKRAEARLDLTSSSDPKFDEHAAQIQKDIDKSKSLKPDDITAYVEEARLDSLRAAHASTTNATKEAKEAEVAKDQKAATQVIEDFVKAHPAVSEGWLRLAGAHAALKEWPGAETAFESANKTAQSSEDKARYQQVYAKYCELRKMPDKAEAAYKVLKTITPDEMGVYSLMGRFYEGQNRTADAIATYTEGLNHFKLGTGAAANRHMTEQRLMTFWSADGYLKLAATPNLPATELKTNLDHATALIEKLKKDYPEWPVVFYLDGKLAYEQDHLQLAQINLKKADDAFSAFAAPQSSTDVWAQTKILLSMVNQRTQQDGLALQYMDQVLAKYPTSLELILRRAVIYLKLARPEDAEIAAKVVLSNDPNNDEAKRVLAEAYRAEGKVKSAQDLVMGLKSTEGLVQAARLQASKEDWEGALASATQALEKDPANSGAVQLAVFACIRLDKKDEAKKIVAAAMKLDPNNVRFQTFSEQLDNPNMPLSTVAENVIAKMPDEFERDLAWASLHAARNDRVKQLDALKKAEQLKPDSEAVVERMFTLGIETKDFALADHYVQQAAKFDTDGVKGKSYEARLAYAQGDRDKAIEILVNVTKLKPEFSMGWTLLGQTYLEVNKAQQGIDAFNRALSQKPDNLFAIRGLVAVYISRGDDVSIKQAQTYLSQGLHYAPSDPQLQIFYDQIGQLSDAIKRRESRRSVAPDDQDNLYRLSQLYARDKRPDKAIEAITPVATKRPDDIAVADALAKYYRDSNRPNEALKLYEHFLTSDDAQVRVLARILLGDLYRSMNQIPQAEALFQEAAGMQADSTDALRRLADMYFDMNNLAQASAVYKDVLAKDASRNVHDIRVLRRYVEALIRDGKFVEADDLLTGQVLKDNPKDPAGLILRAYSLIRQRRADEAMKNLQTVLADNPNNTDALHYRALTSFRLLNDRTAALTDLERLRALLPDAIQSRVLLAEVYTANKQFSEASLEYKDVLTLRPDLLEVRKNYVDFLSNLVEAEAKLGRDDSSFLALRIREVKPAPTLVALLVDSSKRYPDDSTWIGKLGDLYMTIGDKDHAVLAHQQRFEGTGRPISAGLDYIKILKKAGKAEEAVRVASQLLGNQPVPQLFTERGEAYATLKQNDAAVADFEHALDMTHGDLAQFTSIAERFAMSMPHDMVRASLTRRQAAAPSDAATQVSLAQLALIDHDYKAGLALLEPLADSEAVASARPLILRMLASGYYQSGDVAAALKEFKELNKLFPTDLDTINNIAYITAEEMHKPKEALEFTKQAAKVLDDRPVEAPNTDDGSILDTIGWVKFLNQDYTGGLSDLERSVELERQPISLYHRARIYQQLHKFTEAHQDAEDAVNLGKAQNDPIVPKADALLKELSQKAAR